MRMSNEHWIAHWVLLNINETLRKLSDSENSRRNKKAEISKAEDAAKTALGELKSAQESLRKALQNKHKDISGSSLPYDQIPADVAKECREPSSEDIHAMLKVVLTRTRPIIE